MAEHTSIMTAPKRILTDAMIAQIEALAPRYPNRRALTLPALHIVNDALRHVPLQAVVEIAAVLGVTESRVCQLHGQAVARLRTKLHNT